LWSLRRAGLRGVSVLRMAYPVLTARVHLTNKIAACLGRTGSLVPALAGWLVVGLLFAGVAPAQAQAQAQPLAQAEDEEFGVRASVEEGFGRIILTFDTEMPLEVRSSSGVVSVTYPEPVELDVRRVAAQLPTYITAARRDPDNRGVRFALAGSYRVNTIEAADRLVIDLLPDDWQGLPPGLPAFILDDLRLRAEQAEESRQRQERAARIARAKPIEMRIGRLPTFTRLSFNWPEPVEAKLTRDGQTVQVVFAEAAKVELGLIRTQLPEWITEIEEGADQRGGLKVTLKVDPAANVRGFPEGPAYMVDVTNPDWAGETTPLSLRGEEDAPQAAVSIDGASPNGETPQPERPSAIQGALSELDTATQAPVSAQETGVAPQPEAASATQPAVTADAQGGTTGQAASDGDADAGSDTAAIPLLEQQALQGSGAGNAVRQTRESDGTSDTAPRALGAQSAADTEQPSGSQPGAPRADTPRPGTFESPTVAGTQAESEPQAQTVTPDAPTDDQDAPLPRRAEFSSDYVELKVQQFGASKRLMFPFTEPVAAAVFRRHGAVWLVFDTEQPIIADSIAQDMQREVRDFDLDYMDGKRILRLNFLQPQLVTAQMDQTSWVITVGDSIANPPAPVMMDRRPGADGQAEATFTFGGASRASVLTDPDSGTRLWVATGFGPGMAVIKPQRFVDFQTIATAHGVVVQPVADDVEMRIEPGLVVVGSKSGLSLSGEVNRSFEAASGALGDIARPGFVNIEPEKMRGEAGMGSVLTEQAAAVSALPESERSAGRLRLAKLYLSSDLAAEGLGMLRYAADEDPAIERDPAFRALYGVAKVQMGRYGEALQSFDTFKLGQSPDIALWRGLAHAGLGEWREAEVALLEGESAVPSYAPERQIKLRLAGARAAIASGDLEGATRFVGQAEALVGSLEAEPELLLVWGMLAERLGRIDQAIGAYDRLVDIDDRKVQTEAILRRTDLQHARDEIEPEDAINTYETLALTWRGDAIELETLRSLSDLYADLGQYRRAFEVMKHAAITDTGSPITRDIEDRMNGVFTDLFIGNRSDKLEPIEGLALFYDFRELTPVGRQGDEMIRALADKLIEVDLLDQAANLLEHQVDNRLTGAARAQIATKLALVHMMNRKPDKALQVISRTRQAVLPQSISKQRIILEARALAETGRADLAVDLLSAVEGDDILRLTADALWRGEKWQEAAETLEKLLLSTWQPEQPLNEAQSYDLMRAAIGYALSGDGLGTGRLRAKFGGVVAGTQDAHAFSIVTAGDMRSSGDFREVVRSIAAIDTLESFLANYRSRFSTGGSEAEG
jgi:tetratricopeptide (TPR) repeat protein